MMMMTMICFFLYTVGDMPTISEAGTISQWLDVKEFGLEVAMDQLGNLCGKTVSSMKNMGNIVQECSRVQWRS